MTSTVVAEVLPGVAVVFGEVPDLLKPGLVDFGVVSAADRRQVSAALASVVGNSVTVAGNMVDALAGAQGLYRVNTATQNLLNAGAVLAVKDGANLGSVWLNGQLVAQARFIPVGAMTAAQAVAAIGPAVAMIGLQMQLSQIKDLVNTNIALTSQVLTTIHHEQWAELKALVATIDRAFKQEQEIGSVPASLWDTVAGSEADLRKQVDLYRLNVGAHIRQIDELDTQRRRAYLDTNAAAILFDSHALISSLRAWTEFQALHAGKARADGADDPDAARLVDIIARDARSEFEAGFTETRRLVDLLTRELRIVAQLPGGASMPLTKKRKDSKATRLTCGQLLEAIEPLAAALHPVVPPLERPNVVAAPTSVDVEPILAILRWFLEDCESLRGLGFVYQLDARDLAAIFGQRALQFASDAVAGASNGKGGGWAEAIDKMAANSLVAVTDRRIITAKTSAFMQRGDIIEDIPIDRVRYVRFRSATEEDQRSAIDLITREEDFRWIFTGGIDRSQVGALAALLAESMTIPDVERTELLGQGVALTTGKDRT